ncbi:hypothetical protein V6N12_001998 [Hibiscus sabdariffa]|uniref:STAS domain-containing protein n=1 Tax=Hibiscus sabdariffa TaxID=183260 RepID=A0ABR2BS74_9ROSI
MGNADFVYPSTADHRQQCAHRVAIPPVQPFFTSLKNSLKETFFPDDPLRQFKNKTPSKKFILGLQYLFPILEWAPRYSFQFLKSDLISGITIASLAIPQGISYAKLANLPPVLGLSLVYAMMGSSRDLAVGTVAVASLLTASMLGKEVNAAEHPTLYLHLAFTATFFAGLLQASLGLLRLGFIVDFLSHATIVGFMAGAATVVILQQLRGILGLEHFTKSTDIISVLHSVFSQTHEIGNLKKGLNPLSFGDLVFTTPYMTTALKTGMVTGIIALAEGIAVGRSFAMFKHYNIDGNKEMIAIGSMNIVGSCFSCYLTTGPFSRSAVNFNAGCKTAMSNIIMAIAVLFTLLFLTPLFHYTPLVVLSAIIISAMLGLVDYDAAVHLWNVDKFDFLVCMGAYIGVVFASVEVGLVIAVAISVLRLLLFVARPRTFSLGNLPNSTIYRNVEQYPNANNVHGVLILEIDAPIYFANSSYLRERITRWIDEEEDKLKSAGKTSLQYVIFNMTAVGNIDTSGISMLEEVKKTTDRREIKLVLANPGAEVMKKLNKSKFLENIETQQVLDMHALGLSLSGKSMSSFERSQNYEPLKWQIVSPPESCGTLFYCNNPANNVIFGHGEDSDSDEEEEQKQGVSSKELDRPNLPPPYDPFNKNPVIEEPQDPKNLQQVFHDMRGDGLINNAVKMFDSLSKDGLTHEALELFAQFKDNGQMPVVVAHTAVIEAYAGAGRSKEALKSFMRMLASGVAPNAYTYTVLIKGLAAADAKHLADAKKYLMEMMGKGMKPNAGTYTAVFEAFARAEKVEEAKEFLGQMKEKGFVPDEKDVRAALSDRRGPVFRSIMSIFFDK